MSHSVFQTAQIMPMNTQVTNTLSPKPSLTKPSLPIPKLGPLKPAAEKLWRRGLVVKASLPAEVGNDSVSLLERCFVAPPAPGSWDSSSPPSSSQPSSSASMSPTMKGKEYGAFGTVTLEKSKLDLSQKQTKSSPQVSVAFFQLGLEWLTFRNFMKMEQSERMKAPVRE
ncbi:hypothetical protein L6164_036231 [Bauhinia variegata]|uniref:Uncharacterized protein n=1 Tax=Bauhinia variegata TaxID=167791 RepID=A0ACB9KGC9_BAUVA|nr:hypothetical protein L6164_036231 [Bauhinia variegata]